MSKLPILPFPQKVIHSKGELKFSDKFVFSHSGIDDNEKEHLKNVLKIWNVNLSEKSYQGQEPFQVIYLYNPDKISDPDKIVAAISDEFNTEMKDEGYILDINEHYVLLLAKTARGMFYAIQSLGFLVEASENQTLPCVKILDWPDLKMRGITDDISRGQVSTMENFKNIIRFLAKHKMNTYMIYIEDLFQFKSYPEIGKNRGALSAKECVELQNYSEKYHVEIIPIFQTLGHYEILLLHPEFIDLADFPGAGSLNVTSEKTYEFLEKTLDEIVPVFQSVYFHMGADESFDVGSGASRQKTDRFGIASVHARHYQRVLQILEKYDKKIMMYGDIVLEHPTILNEIPKDLIMFDWHYDIQAKYESAEIFKKANQPFIVSAGCQNWSRFFPAIDDAKANIFQFTKDGYDNGALGSITSSWGDFGAANFRELNYYAYAFSAACSWNIHQIDYILFEDNFFKSFYGCDDPAVKSVYHHLSRASQYYEHIFLYAHPFYPIENDLKNLIYRANHLEPMADVVQKEILQLKKSVKKNTDHLDFLQHSAELYAWTGKLSQLQLELLQIDKYAFDPDEKKYKAGVLTSRIENLVLELENIKKTFESLWLRTNRKDNLKIISDLFDRIGLYLEIKLQEIKSGDFSFNGKMPAPFVSHPVINGENNSVVYARRRFYMEEKTNNTWIQIAADSDAEIWINEKKVGRVFSCRSLSAIAENERVKAWEVSDLITQGENIITIKVKNYRRNGNAAFNCWFEAVDVNVVLTSDCYWLVNKNCQEGWQKIDFDDRHWLNSVPIDNSWIMSRPYFSHNLPGRIEFFRKMLI